MVKHYTCRVRMYLQKVYLAFQNKHQQASVIYRQDMKAKLYIFSNLKKNK
jgi:hypothetical protein